MTNDPNALKQLLIRLYFPQYQNVDMCHVHLSVTSKDIKFLKILALPKRLFRRYELLVQDSEKTVFARRFIPYKEIESITYFIEMIKKYSNDK
jgi:hypothetical protein